MSDPSIKRRVKKWIVTAIKLLVVVVVIWFIHQTLVTAWRQLAEQKWQWRLSAPWMALSAALYLSGTLFCGLFWHHVLHTMGQKAGLGETLRAYYIGQLGKYVPGKAMVVILRTGLIRSHHVDTTLAAVSVFFETLTMMAVGAFLAAAVVAIWFSSHLLLFWASVGIMLVSGIPVLPPVFRRLVRLLGVGKWNATTDAGLARIGYRTTLLGWILNFFAWLLMGLSLWALLRSMGAVDLNPLPQLQTYIASVSLATVAGFVSLIPGGAGVREAVLIELMKPQFGDVVAVVGAVLLRLVWLVAELVISGILYLVARRNIPDTAHPTSGE